MIIGGQAVLLYGEPRLTREMDITPGVNTNRLDELLAVIKKSVLNTAGDKENVLLEYGE